MGREVAEGIQTQGAQERIAYPIMVTPAPASIVEVAVYDMTGETSDVTATVLPSGSASIAGSVITLPLLRDLTANHLYRVEVRYEDSTGNRIEPFFWVRCRD